MKNIVLFLILFLYYSNIKCQTFVGPVIGMDYSKMQSDGISNYQFKISDNGYSIKSPLIGVKLEQSIYNSFYLGFKLLYTKKNVHAENSSIGPIDGITFNYFINRLDLKYKLLNWFYLGIGGNLNLIQGVHYSYYKDTYYSDYPVLHESGISFYSGFKLYNFDFEISYYNGFSSVESNDAGAIFSINQINSIGFNLSYDYKIFNRFKINGKKSMSCPKF